VPFLKLLIVADLHYSLPQFDWVVQVAGQYDAVILAGDLLDAAGFVGPAAQVVVVRKYLQRLKQRTRLLVCSGNHDLDALGVNGEKQAVWLETVRRMDIPVDGDTLTIGEWLVTICPWWDGPQTQQAIDAQLRAAAAQRKGKWIWVYHAPPANSPIAWGGERFFGDASLSKWVGQYQPDIVFCGHVHEAPFVRNGSWADRIGETWLFNAGRQIGDIPTAISVETDRGEAAWFSLEGAESVKLDAPLMRPIQAIEAMPDWMGTP